jgi:hypothetical protein
VRREPVATGVDCDGGARRRESIALSREEVEAIVSSDELLAEALRLSREEGTRGV